MVGAAAPEPAPRLGRRDLLPALAAGLLAALVHLPSLGLGWTHDDLFQLRYVRRFGAVAELVDPATVRALPGRMTTPLLFLSYEADLGLFGEDPRAWRVHQLVSAGLAAVALYLALRAFAGRATATAGAVVAFAGPAVASLGPLLMVRHYLEGLALAALATVAAVASFRAEAPRRAAATSALSAGLFALAVLAKEVFVPLPLWLATLPEATPRRRLARLLPHGLVVVAYAGYRRAMLGEWLGGYGWAAAPGDWPRLALALPAKLARAAVEPAPGVFGPLLALGLAAAAALAWRRPRSRGPLATGVAALLLPLLPVSTEVPPRYAALPWIALAATLVVAADRFAGRRRTPALASLVALALAGEAWALPRLLEPLRRQDAEAKGFLALDAGDLLRRPESGDGTMSELVRLVAAAGRPAAGWFDDDLYLCLGHGRGRRVFELDAAGRALRPLAAAELRALLAGCSKDPDLPLEVELRWDDDALRWRLGPRRDGRYRLLLDDGVVALDVAPEGGFHAGARRRLLRIRYTAPDGRATWTPKLAVEPGEPTRWSSAQGSPAERSTGRPPT